MLQMAAAVTQCGGILPPIPPITMANITGENTSSTSSAQAFNSQVLSSTPPLTTKTSSDEGKSIGDKGKPGNDESSSDGTNRENMGKALMQLYGMGQGMNSFPSSVSQANPFLHPTMFSATGKFTLHKEFKKMVNTYIQITRRPLAYIFMYIFVYIHFSDSLSQH